MRETGNSEFWRCTAGSAFGLALAVVAFRFGFVPFLITTLLVIVGGMAAWFMGRILD